MFEFLGLHPIAAAHAPKVDQLIIWIHYLMFLLFVGWGIFFTYTLVRFRKARNQKADYEGVKSHYSTYLEVAVAIFEAFLLIGFSMPYWAEAMESFPPEKESTVVKVVAEQFKWNFHYAGNDGVFGKTSPDKVDTATNPLGLDLTDPNALDDVYATKLYLPKDKNAILKMTSKDVIHSFGAPHFRLKQDTIPGLMSPIWFKPTVTNEEMKKITGKSDFVYEIACSQLCGSGHAGMRGFINVVEKDEFDKWLLDESNKAKEESSQGPAW